MISSTEIMRRVMAKEIKNMEDVQEQHLNPFPPTVNGCRQPLMMAGVAAAAARVSVHVA